MQKKEEEQNEKQLHLRSLQLGFQCICARQENSARHKKEAHSLDEENITTEKKKENGTKNANSNQCCALKSQKTPHLNMIEEQPPFFDTPNSEARSDCEPAK